MEEFVKQLLQNGGPIGVLSACVVYLVVYFQRKQTSEKRDDDYIELNAQMTDLRNKYTQIVSDKQLIKKDVEYLLKETNGLKDDIKDIKLTLNTMSLALERIAAKYEKQ